MLHMNERFSAFVYTFSANHKLGTVPGRNRCISQEQFSRLHFLQITNSSTKPLKSEIQTLLPSTHMSHLIQNKSTTSSPVVQLQPSYANQYQYKV